MKTRFKAVCRFNCSIEGHRRREVFSVHAGSASGAFEAVADRMRRKHHSLIEQSGSVYEVKLESPSLKNNPAHGGAILGI